MMLNRRDFLRLAGLIGAGAAASGACGPLYGQLGGAYQEPAPMPAVDWPVFQALNRLTYGPTPEAIERANRIGLAGWVEEQLAPQAIDDGPTEFLLRRFEALAMAPNALERLGRQEVLAQLRSATLLRQIYSRRQLFERMVGFWTDHFNVSVEKGDCWMLKPIDDRVVIRAHSLGRFEDLLLASAQSPAMLVYLDNQANKVGQPNENYAREVMELHTLGVNGGYSQRDVMELARCLTGWTVKEHFWKGEFTFKPELHDQGVKQVLGAKIESAGQAEVEQVLRRLSGHPATAEYLATKLVGAFIVDDPIRQMPDQVTKVAASYRKSGGDIRAVMRTLLLDGLVPLAGKLPVKIKRPLEFVTSALRALAANTDANADLQRWPAAMGQPLFAWPTPDGPPADSSSWKTSLLPRWQFALALARNEIKGTEVSLELLSERLVSKDERVILDEISRRLLGATAAPELEEAAGQVLQGFDLDELSFQSVVVAGLIASPPFQLK